MFAAARRPVGICNRGKCRRPSCWQNPERASSLRTWSHPSREPKGPGPGSVKRSRSGQEIPTPAIRRAEVVDVACQKLLTRVPKFIFGRVVDRDDRAAAPVEDPFPDPRHTSTTQGLSLVTWNAAKLCPRCARRAPRGEATLSPSRHRSRGRRPVSSSRAGRTARRRHGPAGGDERTSRCAKRPARSEARSSQRGRRASRCSERRPRCSRRSSLFDERSAPREWVTPQRCGITSRRDEMTSTKCERTARHG
jgi:hypothetical protein